MPAQSVLDSDPNKSGSTKVKYEVKANLNVRKTPAMTSSIIRSLKKGSQISIYKEVYADRGLRWGKVSKSKEEWVDMEYLKVLTTPSKTAKNTTGGSTNSNSTTGANTDNNLTTTSTNNKDDIDYSSKENTDKAKNDTIYGNKASSYASLYKRYLKAFGCPPMFTEEVDPRYTSMTGNDVGRAAMKTWFASPSILSLCPGTVDYLPGFGSKDKDQFFNKIKDSVAGDVGKLIDSDKTKDLNGPLYSFKSAYKDYINVVNLLARTSANLLGIGDVSDLIPGDKIPLNQYDYGFYTVGKKASKADSLFDQIKGEIANDLTTAVTDSAYIHFFVNYTTGVTGTESIRTEDEASWLEGVLGTDSDLSSMSRTIQFLFGNDLGKSAESDLQKVFDKATTSSDFLAGLTNIAANSLKGGQLVFPKMIRSMSYDKTIQCELTFSSPYGDKRSIFKYVILPALHLLAMATPKQISSNMYTYPFLVRAYQKGNVNTDLAYISSLELTRGGNDNTSWTVDGLATELVARFTITPLYANMMVTSAVNPFLFMQNSALLEYLGTMCGIDLKQNNLDAKVKLAKDLLANRVFDIPTNLARNIVDSNPINVMRSFTQIVGIGS